MCVGPLQECSTNSDCYFDQDCFSGFCFCYESTGDLFLKDEIWVCADDPFDHEEPIDPCDSNPCFNGVCLSDGSDFSCVCEDHWFGDLCGEYEHCEPNPCHNDGVCVDKGNHFECVCTNKFEGKLCEANRCDSWPCGVGICSLKERFTYFTCYFSSNFFEN